MVEQTQNQLHRLNVLRRGHVSEGENAVVWRNVESGTTRPQRNIQKHMQDEQAPTEPLEKDAQKNMWPRIENNIAMMYKLMDPALRNPVSLTV